MKKITETKNLNNLKDQSCKSIKESGLRAGTTAINKQGVCMDIIKGVRDKAMDRQNYVYNSITFLSLLKTELENVELSVEQLGALETLICDYLRKHEAKVKDIENRHWHQFRLEMLNDNFNFNNSVKELLNSLEKIDFVNRNLFDVNLETTPKTDGEFLANIMAAIRGMNIGIGCKGWNGGFKLNYFLLSAEGEKLEVNNDTTKDELKEYLYKVVVK